MDGIISKTACNKWVRTSWRVALPLAVGAFVLYWVYRDFDFAQARQVLLHQTNWGWMGLSLVFGVLSHVLRGWRWRLALTPLGCRPRLGDCVDAIFISYAASLVLPRIGEVTRCGVLRRSGGVPFSQSLGTVVTERLIDVLCVLVVTALAFAVQLPVFITFFAQTGTKIPSLAHLLGSPWFYVSLLCVVGVGVLAWGLLRLFGLPRRLRAAVHGVCQGLLSVSRVRSVPLFVALTVLIWVCYYLHFTLTFLCFPFTAHLSPLAGLVMFVAGTIAVIVPTPNGAGPWHFAVITMMMLYGVSPANSGTFALIVHGVQTLLVILLGVGGWLRLQVNGKWTEAPAKTPLA